MASYSAVIDVRVQGQEQIRALTDGVSRINQLIKQVKPIPTLFDRRTTTELTKAKDELTALVKKYADGKQASATFSTSIAGVNNQLQAFNAIANNARVKSDEFNNALKAGARASQNLLEKELERFNTLRTIYERQPGVGKQPVTAYGPSKQVNDLLNLGKTVPNSIAALEAYQTELRAVQRLVGLTSQEFGVLAEQINKVDVQLGRKQFGPELPPGGVPRQQRPAGMPGAQGPTSTVNPLARRAKFQENLMLGAGFPLLFGGGPGSVAGGLVGSFVGEGFGGQILGSAIGQIIDEMIVKVKELGDAMNMLNMDKLRDSAILVTAELQRQVDLAVQAGTSDRARELVGEAVQQQTGMTPENVEAVTNAVQMLQNAWDNVYASVSGIVGTLSAPFIVALAKIFDFVNLVVTGWNKIFGWIGAVLQYMGLNVDAHKAINEEVEKQKAKAAEIADNYREINAALVSSQQLELSKAAAQAAGNERLVEELQLAEKIAAVNKARDEELRKVRSELAGLSDEERADAEDQIKKNAKLKTAHLERLSALEQITIQYKEQVQAIKNAADTTDRLLSAEKQRVSLASQLSSAQASAEIAVNNVIKSRLETQLQNAATDGERLNIARQIYKIEVANAKVAYLATLARINAQVRLAALEVSAQKVKYAALEAEIALAEARGESTEKLEQALKAQGAAVQAAAEALKYAKAIAKEQRKEAAAVYEMALQRAKDNFDATVAIKKAKEKNEVQKENNKLQEEASKSVATGIDNTATLIKLKQRELDITKELLKIETQRVNMATQLIQERKNAEIAVNDVILARLEHELKGATTAQQRLKIAKNIYAIEKKNAELTYNTTIKELELRTKVVALKVKEQDLELKALEQERQILAEAQKDTTEIEHKIKLKKLNVQLVNEELKLTREIVDEQLKVAKAVYAGAIFAAKVAKETNAAAEGADKYAKNMAKAVVERARERREQLLQKYRREDNSDTVYSATLSGSFTSTKAYAEGGYVTRPTNALIGEGGEPEYIIPASKMAAAMERYSTGARGAAILAPSVNPQVSITTGPVMQMNGTNYVSQNDLLSATQAAARQGANMALNQLERDPATRRRVGVMR